MSMPRVIAVCLVAVSAACSKPRDADPPASAESRAPGQALEGREWILVGLGDASAPAGAGGRPATLQLDASSRRASGFAGCNRYSGTYALAGDSLTFGPAMSTKMFCQDGAVLEQNYLAVLPEVRRYMLSDSTLTLSGAAGVLARLIAH